MDDWRGPCGRKAAVQDSMVCLCCKGNMSRNGRLGHNGSFTISKASLRQHVHDQCRTLSCMEKQPSCTSSLLVEQLHTEVLGGLTYLLPAASLEGRGLRQNAAPNLQQTSTCSTKPHHGLTRLAAEPPITAALQEAAPGPASPLRATAVHCSPVRAQVPLGAPSRQRGSGLTAADRP